MTTMQSGNQKLTESIENSSSDPDAQKSNKVRMADTDASKDMQSFLNGPEEIKIENAQKIPSATKQKRKIPILSGIFNKNNKPEQTQRKLTPEEIAKIEARQKRLEEQRKQQEIKKEQRKTQRLKIKKGLRNVRRRYINKNAGKKATKLAAMGLGATALGIAGLSAGLASNNDEDIVKLTAAGVAGGAVLGNQVVKQGEVIKDTGKKMKDSFQKGYHGGKYYDEVLNPKLDKQWKKDPKTVDFFQSNWANWEEKLEEGMQLRKQGITDEATMKKAIKLKDKNPGLTIEQAGDVVNFANEEASRGLLMQEGGKEKVRNRLRYLLNGDEEATERALNAVKQYHEIDQPPKERNTSDSSKTDPENIDTTNIGDLDTDDTGNTPEDSDTPENSNTPET